MTDKEMLRIAMEQSAMDINCDAADFLRDHPVIVKSGVGPGARKYYKEPIACNLVSYGNNIVASVRDEYREIIEEYIKKFEFYHCFETPNMHWLNERMVRLGQKVCFMAEYYLPDAEKLQCRLLGGLRDHVADRSGCAAGLQETRCGGGVDQPFGVGNHEKGKSALLLFSLVEYQIRAQRGEKRIYTGLGGNDSEAGTYGG